MDSMVSDMLAEDVGVDSLTENEATLVYDKEDFEPLPDEEVEKLCKDYASFTRINLAEDHGQVVNLSINYLC